MITSGLVAIEEIVEKSKKGFSGLSGVTKVGLFGSLENKEADRYSDVDLVVKSNKPQETMGGLIEILNKIDKFYVVMPISLTETERVYTIVWRSYPFYQRTDLKLLFTTPFSTKNEVVVYDERSRIFHDFFIGAIRYTKYRKRKMDWSAYKFFRASLDMWTRLQTGSSTLEGFIKLDQSRERPQTKWLYPKNTHEMNRIIIEIAGDFLKLSAATKTIESASSEYKFGTKVIEFLHGEIGA